jgi:PAS domain S-box-containing protein
MDAFARLASLVESSEDAIISKDLNGTILSWNGGAAALYGYTAEEAIGKPISILLPPDRASEDETILEHIRAGQRMQHFETVRLHKDGKPIDVSLTISPIRQENRIVGASHVARDISERKRLDVANARLAAIVESSQDAIIGKDLQGIVQTWNSGAETVYGYKAAEVIGHSITFLLPPERASEEHEILSKIARGERVEHFKTTRLHKDGSLIHVSLTISPIRDSRGQVVGASHVARDVTIQMQLEEQMRQMQRLESLGVLAGGIAHDFNNLLAGIIGNGSLLTELLPPQHEGQLLLKDLLSSADRAADLTRQMLAYSGKGQFVVAPLNLTEAIEEIAALVSASIPKTVTLELDLSRDLPPITAGRSQIQQLIMNLITNGAEAIGENQAGRVLVRTGVEYLDERLIQAGFQSDGLMPGVYVWLEVRDNGIGMDEETKSKIFDPFFTTKFFGRGLGLPAALGIAKAHHGAIRVYSTPGEGSLFRVLLRSSEDAPALQRSATKGTILVADDEAVVRKIARATLEGYGYRVLFASNGKEVLEVLRSAAEPISLVILDLTMPVMSGEEALRQVQSSLPVILSSGYSEDEVMRRLGGAKTRGFLQKPYTSAQLREKVDAVLK